ncbi:MAG: phosphatidate cytidylyltransferase [Thermodesulfobacteriota bacterium]
MHVKRWITGLTALPILVYLIYLGGPPFTVFVGAAAVLALAEFFRILFGGSWKSLIGILPVWGMALGFAMIWAAHTFTVELVLLLLVLNILFCAVYTLIRFKSDAVVLERVAQHTLAMVYIPVFLACVIWIRNGNDGMLWVFFLLAIIFGGDIGAFYTGTYFGKHKLCPSVSPGKTIEGALGGLGANVVVGSLIKLLFLPEPDWGNSILFFVCAGIAGQVGDLFESAFKRASGIKDSGMILPGHGGILDRIDALLFALPVAYFFKKFILWV